MCVTLVRGAVALRVSTTHVLSFINGSSIQENTMLNLARACLAASVFNLSVLQLNAMGAYSLHPDQIPKLFGMAGLFVLLAAVLGAIHDIRR